MDIEDHPGRIAAKMAAAQRVYDQMIEEVWTLPADQVAAIRMAFTENRMILTDYPYHPTERPLASSASGVALTARFLTEESQYAQTLRAFARHTDFLTRIPATSTDPLTPYWDNPWFPRLDCVSLYGLLAENKPDRYIEVGSGISTRFARQAVRDLGLSTKIVSIDPQPRHPIEGLCDEIITSTLEDMPASFWINLAPADMVFIDNSHRSFPGSDVTVFFTEIMPALPSGTIYGIHDIFLPDDYPMGWKDRYYNEQYLLLTYLLGGGGKDEIVLPVNWAASRPGLRDILSPLWKHPGLFADNNIGGGCFWMRRG